MEKEEIVVFTSDDRKKLEEMVAKAAMENVTFSGMAGVTNNIIDMLHNVSKTTLENYYDMLFNQTRKLEDKNNGRRSSGNSQVKAQLDAVIFKKDLVDMILFYRESKMQEQEITARYEKAKKNREELKKSTMTPQEQLTALDKEIEEFEKALGK